MKFNYLYNEFPNLKISNLPNVKLSWLYFCSHPAPSKADFEVRHFPKHHLSCPLAGYSANCRLNNQPFLFSSFFSFLLFIFFFLFSLFILSQKRKKGEMETGIKEILLFPFLINSKSFFTSTISMTETLFS